ncbi:MAG: hypothetical protein VKJ64_08795 [Leptolyngbyaceae bacterium]|nr:hypothetical protein [Leptolyngbyaceae bacterium]
MSQSVKYIKLEKLVLWTENPRDPIDENASDQDIVNRALQDKEGRWNLKKLAKDMGKHFDCSEIPTVVYHKSKPVVYDGNRRVILGKIQHGLVSIPNGLNFSIPNFPSEIPCNVCSQVVALDNILRKHTKLGSWGFLERDIFLHYLMNQEKSVFLLLDEITGIISNNPHLNQRFVKEELLKEGKLKLLGFLVKDGQLYSSHSDKDAHHILSDLSNKVKNKNITTRGDNRGKVLEVLEPSSQKIIDQDKDNDLSICQITFGTSIQKNRPKNQQDNHLDASRDELTNEGKFSENEKLEDSLTAKSGSQETGAKEPNPSQSEIPQEKNQNAPHHPIGISNKDKVDLSPSISAENNEISPEQPNKKRQSRRVSTKKPEIFGGKLYLQIGEVSNLYRDITDFHTFYVNHKKELSQTFPSLIRMSLRLLLETAVKDVGLKRLDSYIKKYFAEAKKNLDQDTKTTLSNYNVTEQSMIQLLHTGAHNYTASSNFDQTIAISIIIGAMLSITHGKDE